MDTENQLKKPQANKTQKTGKKTHEKTPQNPSPRLYDKTGL